MLTSNNKRKQRLQEIETIAQEVRQDAILQLKHLGLSSTMFSDIDFVANVLTGGLVKAIPNLAHQGRRLAGLLIWNNACPEIMFELYDPRVRQRFSIAHELGHFFIHAANTNYFRCSQGTIDPNDDASEIRVLNLEEEADAFAGAFLLPKQEIQMDLDHFGLSIAFLAARYEVSEATMRRRIRTILK